MELDTKLPVPAREARQLIENNFIKIESALNDVETLKSKVNKLQKELGLTDDELKNL